MHKPYHKYMHLMYPCMHSVHAGMATACPQELSAGFENLKAVWLGTNFFSTSNASEKTVAIKTKFLQKQAKFERNYSVKQH